MRHITQIILFICMLLTATVCFAEGPQETDIPGSDTRMDDEFSSCIRKCYQYYPDRAAPETRTDCRNSAEFIEDVTMPDGTVIGPGEAFYKVWRLKNTGTCTWDRSYRVVSTGELHMGGTQSAFLDTVVKPGETAFIGMEMTSPVIYGEFKSEYMLEDGNGNRFGITGTRTGKEMPFWLKLSVIDPSACSIVRVSPYSVWRYSDFDSVFRIKNNSGYTWKTDEVDVRVTNGAEFLKYPDKVLIDLPEDVQPGEAGTVIFDMIAPEFEGDSEVTIQLLRENEVICTVTNRITFQ